MNKIISSFLKLWFRARAVMSDSAVIYHSTKLINIRKIRDCIKVGDSSHVRGELLVYGHGGEIKIGNDCYVGEGTRIWSAKKITIGDRVLIAHDVNIHDNISHPSDPVLRHEHFKHITTKGHPVDGIDLKELEIYIEDDVWIGFNATILRGVRIGKGAIVGAASVVTKDVAPYKTVVGNPARELAGKDQ